MDWDYVDLVFVKTAEATSSREAVYWDHGLYAEGAPLSVEDVFHLFGYRIDGGTKMVSVSGITGKPWPQYLWDLIDEYELEEL